MRQGQARACPCRRAGLEVLVVLALDGGDRCATLLGWTDLDDGVGRARFAGLLDVVAKNSVDISSVLMRTNIEKLSILPSGTQHPRATELLASDAMVRLLDDMARRYSDRIIIFDSPPLLLTTESRAIATHMGQIVIVVNAGNTAQAAVMQAVATLEACPVKMMVLNQARQAVGDGYGYGYGYGYGNEN